MALKNSPAENEAAGAQAGRQFNRGFQKTSYPGQAQGAPRTATVGGIPLADFLANEKRGMAQMGVNWKQMMLGAGAGTFSPWIGARMMSSGMGGGGRRGGGGGLLGAMFGGGGPNMFAEFYIAIAALRKAFEFGKEQLMEGIQQGFKLFTRASQLGLSAGKIFQLQQASKATGMPEDEILKMTLRQDWGHARSSLQLFGDRSKTSGMQQQVQEAMRLSEDTAKTMNRVAGEFYNVDIAGQRASRELQGFRALLIEGMSEPIRDMMNNLELMVEGLNKMGVTSAIGREFGTVLIFIDKAFGMLGLTLSSFALGLKVIADSLATLVAFINNLVAKLPGASKLGITHIDIGEIWKDTVSGAGVVNKQASALWRDIGLVAPGAIPNANAPLSRTLPKMSGFEHMGFNIGGMSTAEYLKQTADHTRQMAADLRQIVQHTISGGAHGAGIFTGQSGLQINLP